MDQIRDQVDELLAAGATLPELFGMMFVSDTGLKIDSCVVNRKEPTLVHLLAFPYLKKAFDTKPRDGRLIVYVQRDEDAVILSVRIAPKGEPTVAH